MGRHCIFLKKMNFFPLGACRKYGKTAGLSCAFDKIPEFMEQGFRFFVGGADYLVIRSGYMNLREQLLKSGFTLRPVAAP